MHMTSPRIIGFIDLGTNSVRLLVVRLNPNGSYNIILQQKEVIRLGEGEYIENKLTTQAMERAIRIITHLIELAKSRGAEEFVAVATSATREASNGEELCDRVEEQTGIRINIISGSEEARLIWLGISSGVDLKGENALFIDIGGGSTEIIIGTQYEPIFLRSLKLGAIRTTGTHVTPEKDGRISEETLSKLRRYVGQEIVHIARNIKKCEIHQAYGSSGTILSLEAIAGSHKQFQSTHIPGYIRIEELDFLITFLAALPLSIRREVQGLNPDRADIIIAGAIILHEVLKTTKMQGIEISSRSLRDGLVVDYISRIPAFSHPEQISIRERSVRHLGKLCHIDETHATQIVKLSTELYQSGMKIGLFEYPEYAGELLSYAAYLHDIGQFISFSNHHQHTYYLITEISLLGFNQHEVRLIALIARYHRKKLPRTRDIPFNDLERDEQRMVRILSLILRFAEDLDRSHDQRVRTTAFIQKNEEVVLSIAGTTDSSLEVWAAESEKESFFRVFRKPLQIEYTCQESPKENID